MKKWIIWISSIVGVVGIIVVLCFTLFGLNEVSIDFKNQTTRFADKTVQEKVISDAEFKEHSCVFWLNKKTYIEKIEKQNPYLKVINIEVVFPNDIVLHCVEREICFAIEKNQKIYFCDGDLKVLEIQEQETFLSEQTNAIKLLNFGEIDSQIITGDFLKNEDSEIIKQFSPALKLNNVDLAEQKALIESIEIKTCASVLNKSYTKALVLKDFAGLRVEIQDANQKLSNKLAVFLATQPRISEPQNTFLSIYEKENGQIVIDNK